MKIIIAILFTAASFGVHAQDVHGSPAAAAQSSTPSFKDEKVSTAYTHYIHLKDALVASNVPDAKKAAFELEIVLQLTSGMKVAKAAGEIAKATRIDEQRMLFTVLSDQMTDLIKRSKLSSGVVYLQYCPMANNNEGAFWLSNDKEIKNPYFGNSMLKCGSVKETIQ